MYIQYLHVSDRHDENQSDKWTEACHDLLCLKSKMWLLFAFCLFLAHQAVPGPRCATMQPSPFLPLSRQAVWFSCLRTPYQMSSPTASFATHTHTGHVTYGNPCALVPHVNRACLLTALTQFPVERPEALNVKI